MLIRSLILSLYLVFLGTLGLGVGGLGCAGEADACRSDALPGEEFAVCAPPLVCCTTLPPSFLLSSKEGIFGEEADGTCRRAEDCPAPPPEAEPTAGDGDGDGDGTIDCTNVTPGEGFFGEPCQGDEDCGPGMPCCTSSEVSEACGTEVNFCECL